MEKVAFCGERLLDHGDFPSLDILYANPTRWRDRDQRVKGAFGIRGSGMAEYFFNELARPGLG